MAKVHIFLMLMLIAVYEYAVKKKKKQYFLMSALLYLFYYIILKDLVFRSDCVWVAGTIETYEPFLWYLVDLHIRNTKEQVR